MCLGSTIVLMSIQMKSFNFKYINDKGFKTILYNKLSAIHSRIHWIKNLKSKKVQIVAAVSYSQNSTVQIYKI